MLDAGHTSRKNLVTSLASEALKLKYPVPGHLVITPMWKLCRYCSSQLHRIQTMRYWNFVNVCYPFHFAKNKCTYLNTSKTIRRYVHQLIVAVVACFSGCTWKFRVQTNTGEIWCHRAWPNRHRHPTHSEHGAMAGVYTVSFLVIRVCLCVPIQCIQFTCDEARSFVHLPFDDLRIISFSIFCNLFSMKQKMLRKRSTNVADVTGFSRDLNEQLLFHGTAQEYIEPICHQGFDWRLAGTCTCVYAQDLCLHVRVNS